MSEPKHHHGVRLTDREALLFEAGVKLGGIFHQYLGTPVAPRTAPALARTIEGAVGLQPYVDRVRVRIDPARGGPTGTGKLAYRYLTPEMLDVKVRLVDGDLTVEARLAYRADLRYALMRIESVRRVAIGARRSARTGGPSRRYTRPSGGSASGPGTLRARGRSSRRRGSPRTAA